MESKTKNKAIVIGGEHHNTLGVVRSLGEQGIEVYLISISEGYSYVSKSKYLRKSWITTENGIIKILVNEFNDEKYKPIIIPTSDTAVKIIDSNLDRLKDKYILSNAENMKGRIVNLMNKRTMNQIAHDSGLNVPKFWKVLLDQDSYVIPKDIIYPCIVKPLVSVDGTKLDIARCNTELELVECLNRLKKKYKRIMIQEYIQKDVEIGLIGCVTANKKEIVIPGVIKKIREYPMESGSASFAEISNDFSIIDLNNVYTFLHNLGYIGIFDMEFLYADGKVYFIEVNFRNGGNGYSLTKAGVNIIYYWYIEATGFDTYSMRKIISKDLKFMMDTRDVRHVLNGDLKLIKWIKDLLSTKAFLFFNIRDLRPFAYKIIKYKGN